MYKAKHHQEKQLVGGWEEDERGVPDFFLEDMLHDDTRRFKRSMFCA